MPIFGKIIIFLGILLIFVGLLVVLLNKVFPLGNLPGDITIERDNLKFYVPFTTGLVISAVLSGLVFLVALIL